MQARRARDRTMLFKSFTQLWRPDVAVDLGTATTRVAPARGRYRFDAPSIGGGDVGLPALAHGVVIDVDAAAEALRPALRRVGLFGLADTHPRVLACAPTDTTREEREAVIEACYRAGAGAVALMPEPVAAALGDGVDPASPLPALVLDIGDGVTDCAVVRRGALEAAFARRVACSDLRAAAAAAVASWTARGGVAGPPLTDAEAGRLVADVGIPPAPGAAPTPFGPVGLVRVGPGVGSDGVTPWYVPAGVVQDALEPVARGIAETLAMLLAATPGVRREVQAAGTGVRLTGGGALIPGMAARVAEASGLPVSVVSRPLDAVVQGARRVLPLAAAGDLWGAKR